MADRETEILRSLRKIVRAIDMQSHRINVSFNVTVPQLLCLYAIQRNPSLTLSGLAEEISLSPSTVNGIADRLEEKGLIHRVRSSQDRRKVIPMLLEAGGRIVDEAPPMLQETFVQRFRRLPEDEQNAIAAALQKTVRLLDAEAIDASPNLLPHDPCCSSDVRTG